MCHTESTLPLISVIVPIYNMAEKLDACIECLLQQTYTNLELLLIDDGSQDDSWPRMQAWAAKDPRIKPYHKENGGVSSARNYGLERMTGAYGTFVDPDDACSTQLIAWLYHTLDTQQVPLSICRILTLHESKAHLYPDEPSTPDAVQCIPLECYDQCADHAHMQCYAALYHADILQQLRFDEEISYGEDVLFFAQALLLAGKVAYLPNRLYYYVEWNDSALRKPYTAAQFTDVLVWARICDLTKGQWPILYESSMSRYMFACTRAFYYSFTSLTDCSSIRADVVQRLRKNWRAVLKMPAKYRREQSKALIALFSPALGKFFWKLTRAS